MLVTNILLQSAQKFSHHPALTMRIGYRTLTLTYLQVHELSCKIAQFFADQGLKRGDRVLLCAPNSPYWICVFWACLLQGYYVVPLVMQSTQEMLDKIAQQTEAKLFISSMLVRCQLPGVKTFAIELIPDLVASYTVQGFTPVTVENDDIAEIMYTSGTTGDPKGVMLSHQNLASNVEGLQQVLRMSADHERILSILPLSHMFEQTIDFLLPFSLGVEIVYAHSHGAIKELLQRHKITKIVAVPEFLKLMSNKIIARFKERGLEKIFHAALGVSSVMPKLIQRLIFWPIHQSFGGRLDTIASGGAPLDPEIEKLWENLGMYILQGYGLTETSPVLTVNTYDDHKIGSVGKPLANTKIRLVHDGEIEVSGPGVFKGYFNNEEKTRESFTPDGWFKTGDMGYFDADGFLFLKGRKKYMIKGPGAQNIFPEDIEIVLNEIEGVKDSCVVGIDKKSGLEIHAVLLLADPTLQPENIINQANDRLASYQHITGWSVWPDDDFARSATRKVKKELVISWIEQKDQGHLPINGVQVGPLITILSQITGIEKSAIHPTTKLIQDLKFDSLMRVELTARLEELHGQVLDERLITAQTTVADLEVLLAQSKPLTKIPRVKTWPRSWLAAGIRSIGQLVACFGFKNFFMVQVNGLENLKDLELPALFMPNHVSLLDGLAITAALPKKIREKISFAAAYDALYEEYPHLSWLAELFFNAFPFPRKEHEHVATGLLNMGTMLDAGYSVVVFPEGRMSESGKLQELKRGAGLVVIEMNAYVVPVHIAGLAELVPYDHFKPRARGVITVTFGKPFKVGRATTYDQATAMVAEAMKKIV